LIRRAIAFAFVAALPTQGARILIAQRPHRNPSRPRSRNAPFIASTSRTTDKTGHILLKYDPDKSFFPIGLWGQVLPDAPAGRIGMEGARGRGFNTIWPINWDDRAIRWPKRPGAARLHGGDRRRRTPRS
jgi:hypothetical protein